MNEDNEDNEDELATIHTCVYFLILSLTLFGWMAVAFMLGWLLAKGF